MGLGMTPVEFFNHYYSEKDKGFREMFVFSDEDQKDYEMLLSNLIEINDNRKNYSNKAKGECLEKLATFLLEKTKLIKVYKNLYTSTNEIDILSQLNTAGKDFINHLPFNDEFFLCECKNHSNNIGVTWVGKFYSLLKQHNCKLGIIFSYYGLSGEGWLDGIGLTKKIYLRDSNLIINLNINDFEMIKKGESIINIIQSKIESLKFDVYFDDLITLHPAQE